MRQVRAIQALRWNYRWRGVWYVLRLRVRIPGQPDRHRGWWWVLRYPTLVRNWQHAVADGVIF